MKKVYALLLCLGSSLSFGQNLVPNPSFEDTIACPLGNGQINLATSWTTLCASPDYYNVCNSNPFDVSVPNNWAGYQQPANGNAYSGFATYTNAASNAREFPSCSLTSPLTIGTKYYLSFKVALALTTNIQANCATDKIGALVTMNQYTCNSLINNNPTVFTDSIITDSLNWTRITGSFVADSSYSYLVIGNFFDDANTDTIKFFNDIQDLAYYYLDDICLSTDSSFAFNYDYTAGVNNNMSSSFSFYPNPANEFLIIDNELAISFDVELFDALGHRLYSEQEINSQTIQLNLNQYRKGIYIVKIISEQNQLIHKFIKQ